MRALHTLHWQSAVRAFVLLAFVARALVPPGFMTVSSDANAGVKVVLCSAHGPIELYYDAETGTFSDAKSEPKKTGVGDPPCAFAALAKLAAPTSSVLFVATSITATEPTTYAVVTPGRGLSAPPPPSTGPPSLSV